MRAPNVSRSPAANAASAAAARFRGRVEVRRDDEDGTGRDGPRGGGEGEEVDAERMVGAGEERRRLVHAAAERADVARRAGEELGQLRRWQRDPGEGEMREAARDEQRR